MFGNTKNIFLKALIVFIIAGSMSSFVYVESHQCGFHKKQKTENNKENL